MTKTTSSGYLTLKGWQCYLALKEGLRSVLIYSACGDMQDGLSSQRSHIHKDSVLPDVSAPHAACAGMSAPEHVATRAHIAGPVPEAMKCAPNAQAAQAKALAEVLGQAVIAERLGNPAACGPTGLSTVATGNLQSEGQNEVPTAGNEHFKQGMDAESSVGLACSLTAGSIAETGPAGARRHVHEPSDAENPDLQSRANGHMPSASKPSDCTDALPKPLEMRCAAAHAGTTGVAAQPASSPAAASCRDAAPAPSALLSARTGCVNTEANCCTLLGLSKSPPVYEQKCGAADSMQPCSTLLGHNADAAPQRARQPDNLVGCSDGGKSCEEPMPRIATSALRMSTNSLVTRKDTSSVRQDVAPSPSAPAMEHCHVPKPVQIAHKTQKELSHVTPQGQQSDCPPPQSACALRLPRTKQVSRTGTGPCVMGKAPSDMGVGAWDHQPASAGTKGAVLNALEKVAAQLPAPGQALLPALCSGAPEVQEQCVPQPDALSQCEATPSKQAQPQHETSLVATDVVGNVKELLDGPDKPHTVLHDVPYLPVPPAAPAATSATLGSQSTSAEAGNRSSACDEQGRLSSQLQKVQKPAAVRSKPQSLSEYLQTVCTMRILPRSAVAHRPWPMSHKRVHAHSCHPAASVGGGSEVGGSSSPLGQFDLSTDKEEQVTGASCGINGNHHTAHAANDVTGDKQHTSEPTARPKRVIKRSSMSQEGNEDQFAKQSRIVGVSSACQEKAKHDRQNLSHARRVHRRQPGLDRHRSSNIAESCDASVQALEQSIDTSMASKSIPQMAMPSLALAESKGSLGKCAHKEQQPGKVVIPISERVKRQRMGLTEDAVHVKSQRLEDQSRPGMRATAPALPPPAVYPAGCARARAIDMAYSAAGVPLAMSPRAKHRSRQGPDNAAVSTPSSP